MTPDSHPERHTDLADLLHQELTDLARD
jgi:hypothetical protein